MKKSLKVRISLLLVALSLSLSACNLDGFFRQGTVGPQTPDERRQSEYWACAAKHVDDYHTACAHLK